jgi:hypothetical protein
MQIRTGGDSQHNDEIGKRESFGVGDGERYGWSNIKSAVTHKRREFNLQ